jgi:hypothetical protein
MRQFISWYDSRQHAIEAKHELEKTGLKIDKEAGEEGIVSSKIFTFTKGEVRRWIYGAIGGFLFGILFGFLIVLDILVIPRFAPVLSADTSAIIFMFALTGAAIVGSGTAIASAIRSNQSSYMKEEWGVAVMLMPQDMRKAREKMSQSGAKRIDEASAA